MTKFPKFRQESCSPSSVLPENPKLNKKRPPFPICEEVMQQQKKLKVDPSTAPPPPLSPKSLRGAILKARFAHLILKSHKGELETKKSDPMIVKKSVAKLEKRLVEEKERLETQLGEKKRLEDLEAQKAKKIQDEIEKERRRQEEIRRRKQRTSERLTREKMEAFAAASQTPLCCSLKEIGLIGKCNHAGFLGYCGDGRNYLQQVELEEGEIYS